MSGAGQGSQLRQTAASYSHMDLCTGPLVFYKNPDQVEHFMRKQDPWRGGPGRPRWEGIRGSPGSLQPARSQAGDLGKGTQIQPAPGFCLIPRAVGWQG